MQKKFLERLEFDKIIKRLINQCVSDMGKEIASRLVPEKDLIKINKSQNETLEAVNLIFNKGDLPINNLRDIRKILLRVKKHGVLSCRELIYIKEFLNISHNTKKYLQDQENILKNLFDKLSVLLDLKKNIESKIDQEKVLDNASDNILRLRLNIKFSLDKLKESLNELILKEREKLRDNIICVKNNRYCLMIKQEFKNNFSGIVHDKSASGTTVFIEPLKIIDLNNKLKDLYLKEQREINKILFELSQEVFLNLDLISQNIYALSYLDFIFAKAKLAIELKANRPVINNSGFIKLIKARSPLIEKNKVVPIDIYIGDEFKVLLITGPNTGGKTVVLKTVGLLVLMAQSGLHIPACESSQISIFKNIFVDIGDEQSVEQNLSTFSAHIKNINFILKHANQNSLILLDEPGAGTDPVEGAALAIAILDCFLDLNSRVIATSHFSELKAHALLTHGFENASCEFDLKNLAPTYKLLIGTPGKSNAFEIAKKIGLDKNLIKQAEKNISQENIKFENLIKNLDLKTQDLQKKNYESEKLLLDLKTKQEKFDHERDEFNKQKKIELENIKQKAERILDQANKKYLALMKNYREKNFSQCEKINQEIKNLKEKLSENKNHDKKNLKINNIKLKVGTEVFCEFLNKTGIILSEPDMNNQVLISSGNFKIKVQLESLRLHESKNNKKEFLQKNFMKNYDIRDYIDVHGHNVYDAIKIIDKYIDDAILANLQQVKIIHGKGKDILRKAIKDYLEKNLNIKSFRSGNFGEGELGVTIVELK